MQTASEFQKKLYELLKQYGAMNCLELQRRYNDQKRSPRDEYKLRPDVIDALNDGAAVWFEYSPKVDRWYVGERSPL